LEPLAIQGSQALKVPLDCQVHRASRVSWVQKEILVILDLQEVPEQWEPSDQRDPKVSQVSKEYRVLPETQAIPDHQVWLDSQDLLVRRVILDRLVKLVSKDPKDQVDNQELQEQTDQKVRKEIQDLLVS
jgi:hypothetical protein